MPRLILALLTALAFAGPAAASDAHQAIMERMDTNGDGLIDDVEVIRRAIFVFSRMDQNRDRRVTPAEHADWPRLAAAHGQPVAVQDEEQRSRRFARMDRDGDGVLIFEEYKQAALDQLMQGGNNAAKPVTLR